MELTPDPWPRVLVYVWCEELVSIPDGGLGLLSRAVERRLSLSADTEQTRKNELKQLPAVCFYASLTAQQEMWRRRRRRRTPKEQ